MPLDRRQQEIAARKYQNGFAIKREQIRQQILRQQKLRQEVIKAEPKHSNISILQRQENEKPIPRVNTLFKHTNQSHEVAIYPGRGRKFSSYGIAMLIATIGIVFAAPQELLPAVQAQPIRGNDRKEIDSAKLEFDTEVSPQAAHHSTSVATEKTATPNNQSIAKLNKKIRRRISFQAGYTDYKDKTKAVVAEEVLRAFGDLMTAAPDLQCRIQSLLRNKQFTIEICSKLYKGNNPLKAQYNSINKTLMIAYTPLIQKSEWQYTVAHELHHAFIDHQNSYEADTSKPHVTASIPHAFSITDTKLSATKMFEFVKYVEEGEARINKLLKILDTPREQLSTADILLLQAYQQACRNFRANIGDPFELKLGDVSKLVLTGKITPSLQVITLLKSTYYPGSYCESSIYMRKIEFFEGEYIGYYYVTPTNDPNREALLMIKHRISLVKGQFRPSPKDAITSTFTTELDAYIYEVLYPYPELSKTIFPELTLHHARRFSAEYRTCRKEQRNKLLATITEVPEKEMPPAHSKVFNTL